MTTNNAAAVVAEHTTDPDLVPERPTHTIQIGRGTYTARCPKMKIWMDAADMVERIAAADAAEARLNATGGLALAAHDRRELREAVEARPTLNAMRTTLLGFVDRCLFEPDRATLVAEYEDDDSDLDTPELVEASMELVEAFSPWFKERAAQLGLRVQRRAEGRPQPAANRTDRRRAGARKAR